MKDFPSNTPPEWFGTGQPEHDDAALGAYVAGDIELLVELARERPLPPAVGMGLTNAENARIGAAVHERHTYLGTGRERS